MPKPIEVLVPLEASEVREALVAAAKAKLKGNVEPKGGGSTLVLTGKSGSSSTIVTEVEGEVRFKF